MRPANHPGARRRGRLPGSHRHWQIRKSVVDGALDRIQAESATAFSEVDLAAITAKVESHAGGFEALNETLKSFLKMWFQSQGGIRVARSSSDRPSTGRTRRVSKSGSDLQAMPLQQVVSEGAVPHDEFRVGDRVLVEGYESAGVVRFNRLLDGRVNPRVGIELDRPLGRHNGTVDGRQYLKCAVHICLGQQAYFAVALVNIYPEFTNRRRRWWGQPQATSTGRSRGPPAAGPSQSQPIQPN